MTRVFIAAPTAAMRGALRALLEAPDFEVVGEGTSLADSPDARGDDVDVVLVTDEEGGMAPMAKGLPPIVALSDDERGLRTLATAAAAGWGLVARDAPAAEVRAALVAVAQGLVVLPLAVAGRLIKPTQVATEPGPLTEPLTPREREVLDLLSQGLANRDIARRLEISEHTVKFHVASIYGKLGVQSRTEAVGRGIRLGLVTL